MQSALLRGVQPDEPPAGLSLIAIANILLRRRRLLLAAASSVALASGVYRLLTPRTYTVQSSFIIDNKDISGAAGLAAQLGVDVGGVDVTKSPDFYVSLLKTADVQGHIADSAFITSTSSRPRRLADIWEVKATSPALRREEVIKGLLAAVSSSTGLKVDVVQLTVTTEDPVLSKALSDAELAQVNEFNLKTRQTRARAERKFTEARMLELQAELAVAEQGIQHFYEVNRQQYLSPALEVEKGRLERRVALAQQTYTQVAQAFERSRIDEVRDTPLITVIQQPIVPVRPDPRGVVSKTIIAFFLTLIAGSVLVLFLEIIRWMRASKDADALEFNRLVADTSSDVRRLGSILTRRPPRPDRDSSLLS